MDFLWKLGEKILSVVGKDPLEWEYFAQISGWDFLKGTMWLC